MLKEAVRKAFFKAQSFKNEVILMNILKFIFLMSTETKKNTWKLIIQLIVSIATAIATTLGVTSCMGANMYF